MINAAQIRAARALLGWSQQELARRAGVVRRTLTHIETGSRAGEPATIDLIRSAFEEVGVSFINEPREIGVAMGREPAHRERVGRPRM